jgi:hypothetical protein
MKKTRFFIKLLLLTIAVGLLSNCKTERIKLRSLAPQNTLIYLETNNLGNSLNALTSSDSWKTMAIEKPNIAAANGVQAAIAITGFETTSNDISLDVKPKFVVILDTNSYESTTISAVEQIVSTALSGESPTRNRIENTTFLYWKSKDNRNLTAAISGNIAFIGNNEATIAEFLAVKAGTSPNLLDNETLSELSKQQSLGFGLMTKKGATEIGNILSIRFAIEASDEAIVRSLITKILPNLIEQSVEEVTWVANSNSGKIEDVFQLKLKPELANNLVTSFEKSDRSDLKTEPFLPSNISSATAYNFKSSSIAFQGFVRSLASQTSETDGNVIGKFSNLLLESYGIRDSLAFFEAIDGDIITAQIGNDADDTIIIANVRDEKKLKASVISSDEISLVVSNKKAILGDKSAVEKYLLMPPNDFLSHSTSAFSTSLDETQNTKQIVEIFSKTDETLTPNRKISVTYTNAKRFGIERIRVSEFGLFGDIANLIGAE